MFTGIIETEGEIIATRKDKSNLIFGVKTSIAKELKIGQSIAHNGVCLTVTSLNKEKEIYFVTAVKETLIKTNLGLLVKGNFVNLERCLRIGDRLDGHFVQGHVDTTAVCKEIRKQNGSWLFAFKIKNEKSEAKGLIIEKGSICINGVSLTVVSTQPETIFSVAIIPHTFRHTNFSLIEKGDVVNIEFDVIGKYISAQLNQTNKKLF